MSSSKNVEIVDMNKFGYLLEFSSETKIPFCVWGEKAVGKTTGVYDWCKENNYRVLVLHLATQDVVDLIGMMKVVSSDEDTDRIHNYFQKTFNGESLNEDEIKEECILKVVYRIATKLFGRNQNG